MPFELGLFLGATWFGGKKHKVKNCLILDRTRYRYQKFLSDIAGQDIKGHERSPRKIIEAVRDWLRDSDPSVQMPSGETIFKKYNNFRKDLPILCQKLGLKEKSLKYDDYAFLVSKWLRNGAVSRT
jgi:hypothetical protein